MAYWSFASSIYGSAWSDEIVGPLFSDKARTRDWLDILAVLAEVQGEFNVIPKAAATTLGETLRGIEVDDDFISDIARGYANSSHSTAGLIESVRKRCEPEAAEWFYFGASVQDLADTWLVLTLRRCGTQLRQRLAGVLNGLGEMAVAHRSTVMAGRTHGQIGLPITFGFKVAGWLAELLRHEERLRLATERLCYGQLCGGVGSVSSLGPDGLAVQAEFLRRLDLQVPDASWTASRDVFADWGNVLALLCSCAERIGQEVFTLQRTEIDELREAATRATIGSITMPHKRNPEIGEHLGTLAKVVRMNAAALMEALPHSNERDARGWKLEWHVIPELTIAAARCVELLEVMLSGLEVRPAAMRANLDRCDYFFASESLMLALAAHTGKQTAHQVILELARVAKEQQLTLKTAALQADAVRAHLDEAQLEDIFALERCVGSCERIVDSVIAALRGRALPTV
uniref:Adenylosuccinate lyase n=1 Tax=Haliea sp. ETY-M TaxID=1055105 RepID=A0A455R337_9GAMM|nr:adenylosuccinate lyase [Haliea sp. ETY-M]